MLNEKPADPGGWKDKLDLLDGMAGEPWTGKEAAWDKLHTRLHKKPAKKRGMWWLAAAVFLLFVLTTTTPPAPTKPPPKGEALRTPEPVRQETTYATIVNTVADAGHPAPKQVTAKTKKTSPLIGQPADTLQQLSTTEPVKPDTPLLVKAPVPKKLRVIHINELEGPPDPAGVATVVPRRYVMPTFRFVLAHTETSGTVSYEKPSTNTPLKIKISKQN